MYIFINVSKLKFKNLCVLYIKIYSQIIYNTLTKNETTEAYPQIAQSSSHIQLLSGLLLLMFLSYS